MLPGMEMLACPNLAVSPEVMQHIVRVESSANPFAIGVVGGQLERQPKNVAEALATVHMLDAKGYNFSVGLAQVNRANLGRYGLNSYENAFDSCANLSAGSHILADCYASAHGDWGKAFSCYYSGNFTTGFRDGYVQKVYASINQEATRHSELPPVVTPQPTPAIALRTQVIAPAATEIPTRKTEFGPVAAFATGTPNYRVTLRSMAIDAAAAATVPAIAAALGQPVGDSSTTSPGAQVVNPSDGYQSTSAAIDPLDASAVMPSAPDTGSVRAETRGIAPNDGVFVPTVRGPNDISQASRAVGTSQAETAPPTIDADRAQLGQERSDAAFVF